MSGTRAWVSILGFVLAYDTWAILRDQETLSSACWRVTNRPVGRMAAYSIWAALTYHLFVERMTDDAGGDPTASAPA